MSKLRGIRRTEKGRCVSTSEVPLESLSSEFCFNWSAHDFNLECGVKSITTGEPRDRIATTGK